MAVVSGELHPSVTGGYLVWIGGSVLGLGPLLAWNQVLDLERKVCLLASGGFVVEQAREKSLSLRVLQVSKTTYECMGVGYSYYEKK